MINQSDIYLHDIIFFATERQNEINSFENVYLKNQLKYKTIHQTLSRHIIIIIHEYTEIVCKYLLYTIIICR